MISAARTPATGQSYLVEPRVYAPPSADLRGVHRRAGDYVTRELAERIDKPKLIADVVKTWLRYANGATTVCFAVNVEHSKHIVEQFKAAGVAAEHCDGETPEGERDWILKRLASGEISLVSNVNLFGEGFDLPRIKCVILARPTESMALYYQMTGRAMRPSPDGGPAIVLDHAGLVHRFGRVTQRLEYTLESAPQPETTAAAGHGLRTCLNCYRMVLASRTVCPECGAELKRQKDLPEFDETQDLELVGSAPVAQIGGRPVGSAPDEQYHYFLWLEEERARAGRQPGWSAWAFKKRFGVFPVSVEVDGVRYLACPASPEFVRQAMFERFAAEGESKKYKPGFAAARCKRLFGDVRKVGAA